MKRITYQITLDDDAYLECLDNLGKLMLFPADGNMTFKVEDKIEEESQAIIVNGVMYSSWEDYRKVRSIKRKEESE